MIPITNNSLAEATVERRAGALPRLGDDHALGQGASGAGELEPGVPAATVGLKPPGVTAQDLLDFVLFEALFKRLKGIASLMAACGTFLKESGHLPYTAVEDDFILRLERAILNGSLQQENLLLAGNVEDRGYRSRLASLARAYRALTLTDFPTLLSFHLKASRMSYASAAAACGRPRHWIANLLARKTGGVIGISVDEAIRLDRALRAKGKIFAGFVAFTQHTAFEPITPIMHQVLGFSGFAQELSSLRRRASLTLEQLAEKIKEATGILILPSLLCHWEQGFNLPSLNMEKVVAAMDVILLGNENLKRVWKDEGPREMLPPYALPYDDKWPERVRKQFDRTADYKGDNPEDLDQSPAYGGDRWTGTASKNRCIKILERYFGYLVNKLGYKVESLSLTLIADWDQVQAFFNFVKERVKRDTYSQDAVTITNVFCNLWAWYLPHLVDEAAKESYWDKRLPTHATGIEESVPGVAKSYQVELLNFEERWNYHLVVIHDQAREFLRESHFKIGSLVGRAAPMQKWDGDWSIVPVLMEKLVRRLPRRILCREAAILCRDLVAAVLSLAHLLRPGTMISLCNKHITPQADGRVWLDIPEKLMKPRGHGGSKGGIVGPLAEFDFMHEVVRRYIVEARPLLVAEGTEDLGNFLTPAYVRHANADGVAGVPLSEELLRHALVCILGYPGYGHRHVGATVMDKQGESLVKIAGVLGNLPPVALRHYIHRTAESKTAMLNALAEQIGSDGEPA